MKLLLGSGRDKRDGWISVDRLATSEPHVVCDLTKAPWPWDGNSVERADADNLLEHFGWGPDGEDLLMAFMNEAHRIIAPEGILWIRVPDFQHWPEGALKDPTHRRYFVAGSFDYWRGDHQTWKVYGRAYGYRAWHVEVRTDRRFFTVVQRPCK